MRNKTICTVCKDYHYIGATYACGDIRDKRITDALLKLINKNLNNFSDQIMKELKETETLSYIKKVIKRYV